MAAGLGGQGPQGRACGVCLHSGLSGHEERAAAFGCEVGLSRAGVCVGLEDSGRGVGSTGGEESNAPVHYTVGWLYIFKDVEYFMLAFYCSHQNVQNCI